MPLGLKIVLVAVVALVVIGGGALGALFFLADQVEGAAISPTASEGPRRSPTRPNPTASRVTKRPPAPPSTRRPPSRPPTSRPPTSRPPTTRPPARPAHLEPQRGYQPVPLPPRPVSSTGARSAARNAPLYLEKVSKSSCPKLPDLSAHPYRNVSDKKLRSRLQTMADCAAAMWKKPMAAAGFQATKVKILTYEGQVSSPCGTQRTGGGSAAFYCSANQQIYMDESLGTPQYADDFTWGNYLMTLDHEFGHHIQARSGILAGAHLLEYPASGSRDYEVRRRIELQAYCFSGLALKQSGEVSGSRARRLFDWGGDSKTHGTADHQFGWGIQGFRYREIRQCNTFSVSSKDVR